VTTKQGKGLEPGDKVIRDDGQVLTIRTLTPGMVRDSRIAEFGRDEWATVFDRTMYGVEVSGSGKKSAK
jgi:hypothetical protein